MGVIFNQGISTIGLPIKHYRISIHGTKGYGIDYGVCNDVEGHSEVATEENLGETTLKVLKMSKEWEDSLLSIRRIK